MSTFKNSILAGTAFAIFFGGYLTIVYGINDGLKYGLISGFLFGLFIFLFVNSKTVGRQTELKNDEGKIILYSGLANHFKGIEAVGGKLYLLEDGIHFQSHKFNVQNHSLKIDIDQVDSITFYNTLGIIPNGLAIKCKYGATEKFVLNGRKKWKNEMEKLFGIDT